MTRRATHPCDLRRPRAALVAIAFAAVSSACVSTDLAPLHEAIDPVSLEEDETELWKQSRAYAERLDTHQVGDAALRSYLDGIVSRLLGNDRARLPEKPRVRVIPSTELNAFALPDGSIYLYSALLTSLTSEDQLAAVLSHELTHFTHRHALREQRSATNDGRAIGAVALAAGVLLLNPGIAMDIHEVWMVAAVAGYSRDLEQQADDVGFARAVRAGYAPAELVRAFERVRDATSSMGDGSERVPFYASHEALSERVRRFRELARALVPPQPANPSSRDDYRDATASAHAGDTAAHLLDADARAARTSLAMYHELRPGSAEGHFLDGWLTQLEGKPREDALTHYQAAVAADATHLRAWRRIGLLERRRRDDAAARDAFQRAHALAPEAPDAAALEAVAKPGNPLSFPESAAAFRGSGPRRIVIGPVRAPPAFEIAPASLRALESEVASALRASGYEVVDATLYAALTESLERSVPERAGHDGAPDEQRTWIHTLVQNELFARYDAEAMLVPILYADSARFENGTLYCDDSSEPLPLDPDGTEYDRASGHHYQGFAGALALELAVVDEFGRPLFSGATTCQPLARIDANGRVQEFRPARRLADRVWRREVAERAVARIRPLAKKSP